MPEPIEELRAWRAAAERAGLGGARLDELEDHLLQSAAGLEARGAEPATAFRAAASTLGDPAELAREFEKAIPAMHPLSKLFGSLLSLSLVAFVAVEAGLDAMVSGPSIVLVTGLVAAGLVASFGPVRIARAIAVGLGTAAPRDAEERAALEEVAARGSRLSWASGLLAMIIGTIQMLANLADPSQLGPGAALAMCSLLYGALLAELAFGHLRQWIAARPPPCT